ncbi:MAG: DUF1848 family protein [Candidatus Schekmanbacteria bacterium]|nr:DUF1848 family protein [Candidatus Schekmanbacteria bacterium]
MRHQRVIISASRRTDIPRYYAKWFAARRAAGLAAFRTAFGTPGTVSLAPDDVVAYLFWTRHLGAFRDQIRAIRGEGTPVAVQFTITGYPRRLEPHAPGLAAALRDFCRTSAELADARAIQWRYDPIVLADDLDRGTHERTFTAIARTLHGATRVVNTSVVEPYLRTIRRLGDPSAAVRAPDPSRHRAVAQRYPHLRVWGEEGRDLLRTLAQIAAEHEMELRACCNPELGLPPSTCCGVELFRGYGEAVADDIAAIRRAPSRPDCRCVSVVDIGMDETCIAGCRYCYAVRSQETALRSFRRLDLTASSLR